MAEQTLTTKKYYVKDKLERLLKIVPIERPGIISYEQWAGITGVDWHEGEGRAIARAWRDVVLEKHQTYIKAHAGLFEFLEAGEQVGGFIHHRIRGLRRRLRKDARVLSYVHTEELNVQQDAIRLHHMAGIAAVASQVRKHQQQTKQVGFTKVEALPRP